MLSPRGCCPPCYFAETTTIALTFKFHCPPARIHEALTDVRDVMRYTQVRLRLTTLTVVGAGVVPRRDVFHCDLCALLCFDPLQAPAKIEPKVGGLYSIYDGAITGEFIRVDHEHIEMKWRMKNWSPACFSTVTIKNTPRGEFALRGCCLLLHEAGGLTLP